MSFFKSLFSQSSKLQVQPATEAMKRVIGAHAAFAEASMLMVKVNEHDKSPQKQELIALFQYGAIDAYSQAVGLDPNATYQLLLAYLSAAAFCPDPQGMAKFVCDYSDDPRFVDVIRLGGQAATDFIRGNINAAGRLDRYLLE